MSRFRHHVGRRDGAARSFRRPPPSPPSAGLRPHLCLLCALICPPPAAAPSPCRIRSHSLRAAAAPHWRCLCRQGIFIHLVGAVSIYLPLSAASLPSRPRLPSPSLSAAPHYLSLLPAVLLSSPPDVPSSPSIKESSFLVEDAPLPPLPPLPPLDVQSVSPPPPVFPSTLLLFHHVVPPPLGYVRRYPPLAMIGIRGW